VHRAVVVLLHGLDEVEGLGDLDVGVRLAQPGELGLARRRDRRPRRRRALRVISKPTTGRPFEQRAERCSPTVSSTFATWSRRTRRPSPSVISIRASSSADCTVAIVRTDCSAPPTSVRPPDASCWIWRSWREMSAAVAFSACSRPGRARRALSRVTPPTR
jgi:hypothetical protein